MYKQNSQSIYLIFSFPLSPSLPFFSNLPKQTHTGGHRGHSIFSFPFHICLQFPSFASWQRQAHSQATIHIHAQRHALTEKGIIKGSLVKHFGRGFGSWNTHADVNNRKVGFTAIQTSEMIILVHNVNVISPNGTKKTIIWLGVHLEWIFILYVKFSVTVLVYLTARVTYNVTPYIV